MLAFISLVLILTVNFSIYIVNRMHSFSGINFIGFIIYGNGV